MAKMLTAKAIESLRPGPERREVVDAGQRGLRVIVQPSGVKSFAVRYRHGGRPRKLTLQPGIGLAEARKLAADDMYQVAQGIDPAAAKQAEKRARQLPDTFRAIAEEYDRREGSKLRSAHWRRMALERAVLGEIGDLPIHEIRRKDIIRLLDKIEDERGPAAADSALVLLRGIMGWHAVRDDTYASPIIKGMQRHQQVARERVLDDDEIRRVLRAVETSGPFGKLIAFLLFTGCRRTEAARMRREEIKDGVWTLPAARNKTGVELARPLSKAALEIIGSMPVIVNSSFVFTIGGRKPFASFGSHKRNFDKVSGTSGWVLHDLRRTCRSLMARAGVPREHAERCLGHTIPGVEGTYNRHKYEAEMLAAYESLAVLIARILDPTPNVRQLRSRG